MKPIFDKEKKFLEENLNIEIPNNYWRNGTKIYKNHFSKSPVITFSVDLLAEKKLLLKKHVDNEEKNYTLEEEYGMIKDELNRKERESIDRTKEYILNHLDFKRFISISGGKDSDVMYQIVLKSINELVDEGYDIDKFETQFGDNPHFNLIAFNTSNDTAQTFLHLKQDYKMNKNNIISPKVGFYDWIINKKNYFLPTVMVRNCCSTYKEGQLDRAMNKKENTLIFLGMRSQESAKRTFYDWDLNEAYIKEKGKCTVPSNWKRFLPIVKWSDAEVWFYILHNKLKYNEMYNMGFDRCGCLFCPYSKPYIDILIEYYYPTMYNRWMEIIAKNYEIKDVERRLKWTLEEYGKGGKWKTSQSKEYEITSKKKTSERIKELAMLKGIPEDIAEKYWDKECKCGKKLNPTDVAMFLKIFGRYEDEFDDRQYLCKKCMCELMGWTKEDYQTWLKTFMDDGCDLF